MGREFTETKEEAALKELIIRTGATHETLNDMNLLVRSIDYANLNNYTRAEDVRTRKEQIQNDIFFIRASSYYRRKKLNPFIDENHLRIKQILENEHREVVFLKAKLL